MRWHQYYRHNVPLDSFRFLGWVCSPAVYRGTDRTLCCGASPRHAFPAGGLSLRSVFVLFRPPHSALVTSLSHPNSTNAYGLYHFTYTVHCLFSVYLALRSRFRCTASRTRCCFIPPHHTAYAYCRCVLLFLVSLSLVRCWIFAALCCFRFFC